MPYLRMVQRIHRKNQRQSVAKSKKNFKKWNRFLQIEDKKIIGNGEKTFRLRFAGRNLDGNGQRMASGNIPGRIDDTFGFRFKSRSPVQTDGVIS